MAQARYERLQGQVESRPEDDSQSATSAADSSAGSERVLSDPPDRHDIWNQPWWLFLLMILLFLGLVAASIGVHAAVCSTKPLVADPIVDAIFTKLVVREQITTIHIGRESNTTTCSISRLSVDGLGPAWSKISDTVSMSSLNYNLGQRILLTMSNALKNSIYFEVQSTLGNVERVDSGKIQLVHVPQADMLLAQINAGTTIIESRGGFLRSRGLSVPMIVGGSLPAISSDYNTDLIGSIDKARDVLFVLQDACLRPRQGNQSRNFCGDCLENSPDYLSAVSEIEFGAISLNNHFEHHLQTLIVEPGIPVRLRVYNSASGTNFFLNITSEDVFAQSQIIAIDGHWISPVDVSLLKTPIWVGIGQRMDILLYIPNRRWTRTLILAVEEGEKLGRQIGMSLQTDRAMSDAGTAVDPPRITPTSLYRNWGNELVYRKPIVTSGFDDHYEVMYAVPTEKPMKTGDVNAILFLSNDNAINGRRNLPDSNATTVDVTFGNQVIITFVNNAIEALPIRVYGHSFVIARLSGEEIQSGIQRDTVLIPPRENVTISFTALNPGTFPIACMNEFRQARGMSAYLQYLF